MKDYDEAESFETAEELEEYWLKDANFKRLENGDYGKLNMLYTYKVVINSNKSFTKFLLEISKDFALNLNLEIDYFLEVCEEILKFQNTMFIQFEDDFSIRKQLTKSFKYDILSWRESGYNQIEKLKDNKNFTFYLSDLQHKAINTQLKQFKSKNLNSTLRDMTTYTDPNQFFYIVKNCSNLSYGKKPL